MTNQLELPFPTVPYSPKSPTSWAAAQRIRPKANALRQQVLDYLIKRSDEGATDHEISSELEMQADTARPRRRELVQLGLVCDSGLKRPTPSGAMATVWIAKTAAEIKTESNTE